MNLDAVRFYLTGGRGLHIEVPQGCFMAEPGYVNNLPAIYKAMAAELSVDTLDLRVYSMGRGRMWRVPNVKRDNGLYKVPLSRVEFLTRTVENYHEYCTAQRPYPELDQATLAPGLAALFESKRGTVQDRPQRSWNGAALEIRQRWNGDAPPSLVPFLQGAVAAENAGWNEIAMQIALLALALDWSEERLIAECRGLIQNHESDSRRYGTSARRESELISKFSYFADKANGFSVGGIMSVLPESIKAAASADLAGIVADSPNEQLSAEQILEGCASHRQYVEAAQAFARDPARLRSEIAGFNKLAAKALNVSVKDFVADVFIKDAQAHGKAVVRVRKDDLAGMVDDVAAILPRIATLRQRGGQLVEVVKAGFVPVEQIRLARLISDVAVWAWPSGGNGKADTDALGALMKEPHLPIPEVVGIASQPTLLDDGSIGTAPGYEPSYNPASWVPYDGSPTEALAELRSLIAEFPFLSELDEAAALAAILTAVARPMLRTAPAFLINAHEMGTGKSYLAETIALFASPETTVKPWAYRDEENTKSLFASLIQGAPAVIYDNLVRDWNNAALAAVLTSPIYTDRVLGQSVVINLPTRLLLIATGNNVQPVKDLARRTITIRLDAACENPDQRRFKRDPVAEVRADRKRWVMLALRFLQGFVQSGRKPEIPPMGSFGEWSALIRAALVNAGLPDPIHAVIRGKDADPEREMLGALLEEWSRAYQSEPQTLKEVVSDAIGELRNMMIELVGANRMNEHRPDTHKMGKWLDRHEGRVVGKRRFVKGKLTKHGRLWHVETVETAT